MTQLCSIMLELPKIKKIILLIWNGESTISSSRRRTIPTKIEAFEIKKEKTWVVLMHLKYIANI